MRSKNQLIKGLKVHSRCKTYHAGLGSGLHSDFSVGVHFEACIEDAIRDLIAKFIRVTLAD